MMLNRTYEQKRKLLDSVLSNEETKKELLILIKRDGIPHGFEHYPPLVHFLKENDLLQLIDQSLQKVAKKANYLKDPTRWNTLDMES